MSTPELNGEALVEKTNVLGVAISAINLSTAANLMFDAIRRRLKNYICVTGVHGVMEAQRDQTFRKVLDNAFLCTPDGMPMVWMGRLQGSRAISRVYGPDLMQEVLERSSTLGVRHFLYGGYKGTGELLRCRLLDRFSGLQIVGVYEPPFRPLNVDEETALILQVKCSKPDIIWVGISTPKQEFFMSSYLHRLDTVLMVGVGAAFDILSGLSPQAPRWMQRSGLEWFFRLCHDPKRLWRRYCRNIPVFLWRAFLQLSGLKKYPLNGN